MKKRIISLITVIVLSSALAQSAFAASVDYYSFTIDFQYNTLYGDLFTNTNSSPTIKGWQDGACNNNTLMSYGLVKKGLVFDTVYAADVDIPYDRINNWYVHQWYSIDTNKEMQIRITNEATSCSTTGAGNVYN